jgi:predicted  nucleic acid-binding Zn-ribbon protein
MNDEQFERRMEFIVEQQAKFEVGIQELREAQSELTKKHNHLTEALTTVVGMVGRLQQAQERSEMKFAELAEAQRELSIKHGETDGRLNTLINVVERYISGNGTRPSSKQPASKKQRSQSRPKPKQARKK